MKVGSFPGYYRCKFSMPELNSLAQTSLCRLLLRGCTKTDKERQREIRDSFGGLH